MERVSTFSQDPLNAQQHCSTLAQGVGAALPGWGEKNFQVMSKQFDVVQAAATHAAGVFSKTDAIVGINGEAPLLLGSPSRRLDNVVLLYACRDLSHFFTAVRLW